MLICMHSTSVRIDATTHDDLKRLAAELGTTVGNTVTLAVRSLRQARIGRDLRASIIYGLEHRGPALAHAKQFNRGIGDERTDTFVGMYVNQWTVDYGPRGRQAVQLLLDRAYEAGLVPERVPVEFVG